MRVPELLVPLFIACSPSGVVKSAGVDSGSPGSGDASSGSDPSGSGSGVGGDDGESGDDDGGGEGSDSGTGSTSPVLEYKRACPPSGLDFTVDNAAPATEGSPTKFDVVMDDIEYDGDGDVLAAIRVSEHSTPWLPAHLRVYESPRPVVNGDAVVHIQSRFVGTFSVTVELTSTDGGTSEPWQCDLNWRNGDRLRVELQVEPGATSDIELHGLVSGAELYSSGDATWCNEIVLGPDSESEHDDVLFDGTADWDGSQIAWVGSRGGVERTVDAAVYARSVLAWEDEARTIPHELSVRAYSFGNLLFDERARLREGEVWTIGRVALGEASSEAAYLETMFDSTSYPLRTTCAG